MICTAAAPLLPPVSRNALVQPSKITNIPFILTTTTCNSSNILFLIDYMVMLE